MTQKPYISVSQLERFVASLQDRGVAVDPDQAPIILEEAVTIARECYPEHPAMTLVAEIIAHLGSQDAPEMWRHRAIGIIRFIGRLIEAEEAATGRIRSEADLIGMLTCNSIHRDVNRRPESGDHKLSFPPVAGPLGALVERARSGEFGDDARDDVKLFMSTVPDASGLGRAFQEMFSFSIMEARRFAIDRAKSRKDG